MEQWPKLPETENFLLNILQKYLENSPFLQTFKKNLQEETSTRLFDWIDHFVIVDRPGLVQELEKFEFTKYFSNENGTAYKCMKGQFPLVFVGAKKEIAIKVEWASDFLMTRGIERCIEGSPYVPYRRVCITKEDDVIISVIERRGTLSFDVLEDDCFASKYVRAKEIWKTRPRRPEDKGLEEAFERIEEIKEILGQDYAAAVILEVEREYWQSRNRAGQWQKARQDRLGLGWANHDHHTFRSSRKYFKDLVHFFEKLGFYCRERFYAGKEAGWGAQVMENPRAQLVLFLDVDLAPEEIDIDFAHQQLEERKQLGTIGLWCALHGDSIFESGMHHLEGQFEFVGLQDALEKSGLGMMKPFSDFSYLKQAFSQGEKWKVDPRKIECLLKNGFITQSEAERFKNDGAIGSHLENLQRQEGYKGFNQNNVSHVIIETDPRKIAVE